VAFQVLNDYPDDNILTSHQLANEIRELYDLSPIMAEEKISSNIITNLNGFLKEYAITVDYEEAHLDVIKYNREDLS
jgi:hypothetical protein